MHGTYTTLLLILLVPTGLLRRKQAKSEVNYVLQQHDYTVKDAHTDIVSYDKKYFNHLELKTFKYNRTCTAYNATLNVNLDIKELDAIVQAYKFASNEYRLFPLRIRGNLCKALTNNIDGLGTYKCGNFTLCNIQKGVTYHVCNFVKDTSKLPPYMPSGHYMCEVQFIYRSMEVAVTRSYSSIVRPEV